MSRTRDGTNTGSGPNLAVEPRPRFPFFTTFGIGLPFGASTLEGLTKPSSPRLRILTCPVTRLLLFLGTAAREGGDELGLRLRRLGCARFGRWLLGFGFRGNLMRGGCDCKGFFRQSWGLTTRAPMFSRNKQFKKPRFLYRKIKERKRVNFWREEEERRGERREEEAWFCLC